MKAKRAKVGQHNPYWSVMTQATKEIQALEKALGISSNSRSKAGKAQPCEESSKSGGQLP
ncbi:P27 family phage terminase small subunit [Microvirga sp. P5_D2]